MNSHGTAWVLQKIIVINKNSILEEVRKKLLNIISEGVASTWVDRRSDTDLDILYQYIQEEICILKKILYKTLKTHT